MADPYARRPSAVAAPLAALAVLALVAGCWRGDASGRETTGETTGAAKRLDAAVICESSAAEVVFTSGRVEVRARGATVGWADGEGSTTRPASVCRSPSRDLAPA